MLMFNQITGGAWVFVLGFLVVAYVAFAWWREVSLESEANCYHAWEDMSFRWGMSWFIFSEVMFFAGFFGALFYARLHSVPEIGGPINKIIWPFFDATWPTIGPYAVDDASRAFGTIPASGLPLINTAILLTSSVTVTWAHWAMKMNNRKQVNIGLAVTIALGIIFLIIQMGEYIHAYQDLNLRLDSGIYGSTFFMLTGFHGMHVTVGTIGLIVIFTRCLAGHFKPDHHFGFEAISWYWHFVDVVWLFLFVIVYWL